MSGPDDGDPPSHYVEAMAGLADRVRGSMTAELRRYLEDWPDDIQDPRETVSGRLMLRNAAILAIDDGA